MYEIVLSLRDAINQGDFIRGLSPRLPSGRAAGTGSAGLSGRPSGTA